jgi:RNA polymerase sigma-70 factor (ECF subfamily)
VETVLRWDLPALMNEETRDGSLDTDAQLMLRFQAGDLRAFERLFWRHSRPLVNFAYRFVRSRETAEELAQEVFLRVHDAAPLYRAQAKFTTWLYRIATNVCLNELRRPRFRAVHQSLDASSTDDPDDKPLEIQDDRHAGPDRLMERRAIARALIQALEQLPEKQRLAFILNKYQELSYSEVAEVMKTSEKAVKSLIHRAKETLAARLKPVLPELI